ncbi:MAG: RNA polymerase sigma factor [Planctomycetota bacterium]|jgi:RNA polymerase sigma-70 factor (ECF subfamily)
MLEDIRLIMRAKRSDGRALRRIYEKYGPSLLTTAAVLTGDMAEAEDILHDVFLSFAEGISDFELTGSLKGYLTKCVANCARDARRARQRQRALLGAIKPASSSPRRPDEIFAADEESRRLTNALNELSPQQREVIVLHLRGRMKWSQIGDLQGVSVNTVKGRYRYGLEKLRSILNGQVRK